MSNEGTTSNQNGGQPGRGSTCILPPQGTKPWKKIVIGGTSGILMGAGGAFAALTYANHIKRGPDAEPHEDDPVVIDGVEEAPVDDLDAPEVFVVPEFDELGLEVAVVDDGMSFRHAFAAAREQVGPGGVFEWRGGLFNTFYVEEWDAMTAEEKSEFAQQVSVTIGADEMDDESMFADRDDNYPPMALDDEEGGDDAIVVEADGEVRILGMGDDDGDEVVVLEAEEIDPDDFAIIDMDDDYELIVEAEGMEDDADGQFDHFPDVDDYVDDDLFEI